MFTAHFTRRFSAAHRVIGAGICERIHGHNFEAEILVETDVLGACNMVVPAEWVKTVVDYKYDHRLILDSSDPFFQEFRGVVPEAIEKYGIVWIEGTPSTEFLASVIADDVANRAWEFLGGNTNIPLSFVRVTVLLRETPTIQATATAEIYNEPDHLAGR